jgi:CLIP-associating protein 1/2
LDAGVVGSYRRIHAAVVANRSGVDPPSARDPPHPASAPVCNQTLSPRRIFPVGNAGGKLASTYGGEGPCVFASHHVSTPEDKDRHALYWDTEASGFSILTGKDSGGVSFSTIPGKIPWLDGQGPDSSHNELGEIKGPKRVLKTDLSDKDSSEKNSSGMPGFQRPLLRRTVPGRPSGSSRCSLDENQMLSHPNNLGESYSYMDGLMSLNDALSEGLSVSADWSARVAAFTFLKKLLEQGPKGLQDINHSFGLVMKLFSAHLDDPHH